MRLIAMLGVVAGCGGSRQPASPITWEPPVELARGGGERGPWRQNDSQFDHVDDPAVAFDQRGDLVVAWADHRDKDVRIQIVAAAGPASPPVNISRTPDVFSWLPRIVTSPAGEVFVLWQEIIFSGGSHGGDILFARSLDGGATFEPPINISRSRGGDGKGRIDARRWHNGSLDLARDDRGALYAAWTEYDGTLWLARSTDRGATFAQPSALAGDRERPARAPSIAVTPRSVLVAWTFGEDPSADVHVARSDDGATFEAPVVVAATPTYSDAPKLAVDIHGTLHLAFAESTGGPFDRHAIHYTRSLDGGRTFEAPRGVSARGAAGFPSIAIDGDAVHVAWEVFANPADAPRGLALATSFDRGATFGIPSTIPHSVDPDGGGNGSFQGRLMRKLVARDGRLAVVNSSLAPGRGSRVWLMRGQIRTMLAR